MDEHGVLAAIVHPHAVRLAAQHDAEPDFTADLLHAAAAAVSSSVVNGVSREAHGARAAGVFAAAVVGVCVKLAQAEARALR